VPGRLARSSALVVAAVGLACDPGDWTLGGARHFAAVDPTDAARELATDDAWLLQVRDAGGGDPRAPGSEVVTSVQPLPPCAVARDRAVLVVGHDDASARRYASRLVRAGFARVFVIRGGIQAWRESTRPTAVRAQDTSDGSG
jgi:rhodanese-related sulfurtransferase